MKQRFNINKKRGFTLVEIIVSVGLFAVVMLISLGSLLSIEDASKKAQSIRTTMDNLNFAVENMVREIRTGDTYSCDIASCSNGSDYIKFVNSKSEQVIYQLVGSHLEKSIDNGVTFLNITAPEIDISNLSFFIVGEAVGDNKQPRVLISITGMARSSSNITSEFSLQTTVSQRKIDS